MGKEVKPISELANLLISEFAKDWQPIEKTFVFEGQHGSHKGEMISYTAYYNELTGLYTDKEEAFVGHLINKIKGMLNENIKCDEK